MAGAGAVRDGPPAVAVEGLTKTFRARGDGERVVAVDDVSFAVPRGSVVGLLGPNGAGKTTALKCLLGLVAPDVGTAQVHGVDVATAPREAYRHIDALLEGARNDYWRLTVRENLRYFATVNGHDPDALTARHDRLLERLDLADWADEPVRNLSRGMKQKASLASALAGGSDVLVLDEPTLGLDVEGSRTLRAELRRVVEDRGLTVLLSSHATRVVEDICDRVLVMRDGTVVADGAVDQLLSSEEATAVRVRSPDLTESVRAALAAQFDVTDVDCHPDGATVEVALEDADGRFYALTDALRAHDVTIRTVETVEPTLEDLLLDLAADG